MGVTPLQCEGIANVVTADESDLVVNDEDLSVIASGFTQIHREHSRTNFGETTNVQMRCLGENVEERILIEDGETVVNDMDVNSAFRSAEQR